MFLALPWQNKGKCYMAKNIYGLPIAKNINGPLMAKNIYDPPMAQNIYGPPMANKHFNVKIWSVLNPSDLFWTTLSHFDTIWSSLNKFIHFEQVWISLNKFDPGCLQISQSPSRPNFPKPLKVLRIGFKLHQYWNIIKKEIIFNWKCFRKLKCLGRCPLPDSATQWLRSPNQRS